ncbi:unnamed protein product [Symbiodinium sp. CCMP2456]|nr:unnamed protein product [Symbiodinium sp. CCMP2456]
MSRHWIAFPCLTLILCAYSFVQAADDEKFVPLFNGENLDGWVQNGGKAEYTVEDGVIVGTSVPKTPNSFLCTEKKYGDFILEVEYMVDPLLNSGIQIRSNVYDEPKTYKTDAGKDKPEAQKAFKQNEWNKYRIECRGDSIKTWINGVPAADLKDDMTSEGFIALQVHGVGGDEKKVGKQIKWRNVKIIELED